ncbi:GEVED domain-containing protein [Ferruginibacter profundus]
MLKKILYNLIAFLLFFSVIAQAQVPAYTFTAASGTYTPVTGGTTVSYLYGTAANADDGYAAVTIGFNFIYNGVTYTVIRPCANGFATFGTVLTGTTDTWTNDLSGGLGTGRPVVAPLWDDMDNSGGNTTYLLSGTAPNRVLTIQWFNSKWQYSGLTGAISFQLKLYETTNVIEFVYNQEAGSVANAGDLGASIGITSTGTGSGSFISLTNQSTNPGFSYTTETNSIATKPATGQIYRWTPYCTAGATDLTREKIAKVQYNTINNSSTSSAGYENFGNLFTQVEPSSVYTMTVTPNANAVATDQVIVYIDLNQNGSFADAGETVYTSAQGAGPYTFPLPVPPTASIGLTRMRIRLHDAATGANATPCGTSTYGQVEDYSLNIQLCSPANITSQPPAATTVCVGNNAAIALAATGTSLTYQWQVSTNGGTSYTNIIAAPPYSGVNTNTLSITGTTLAMSGNKYKCILNGTCTPANSTSNVSTLTVNSPASLTLQPVNVATCYNGDAIFTVAATGTVTYQWQVSTDGGFVFSNINGATAAALVLSPVKENVNGNRYRCVVTVASCGSVISAPGILTVNLLPSAFITADPVSKLKPGLLASLNATAIPSATTNAFTWYKDGTLVGTGAKLDVNYMGIGDYTLSVTDAKGCSNTSTVFYLGDSVSNRLFITPNPNNGKFQVIYHNTRYNSLHRKLTVYDSWGTRIWTRDYTVSGTYQPMDVDMRNYPAGIYLIQLGDFNGKPLASGNVFIHP